jgi:hypothetical protein
MPQLNVEVEQYVPLPPPPQEQLQVQESVFSAQQAWKPFEIILNSNNFANSSKRTHNSLNLFSRTSRRGIHSLRP